MMAKCFLVLISSLTLGFILLLSSCSSKKGEGFAIYLTKDDISPAKMEALSHVDLSDDPIISFDDILSYDAVSHEMKLTDEAYERIAQLVVPMTGKSFLVCVHHSPIYWGAFWVDLSSQSFDGVTISKPLIAQDSKVIALSLGYPNSSFYSGQDPRSAEIAMNSLDRAGKLTNKP